MSDFAAEVGRWVDKAKANAQAAFEATAQAALARVRELTPVQTGFLRANWTVLRKGDVAPVAGPNPLSARISDIRLGDVIVLLNPVIYAARIEFGFVGTDSLGRHYNQPGVGMLQQTIAEMPKIAVKATASVLA